MTLLEEIGHQRVLGELESLVAETYQLWDREWVGFSWRNYTFDHVQRVRALARTIARNEGGDVLVTDYAGLLHDITKSYDGEIVVGPDGKRILDENGFWKNEVLKPNRQNHVTELYDQLDLYGTLHNVSGAIVADALLAEIGFPEEFRQAVGTVIRSHLKSDPSATLEGRALYDADTIDSNIGLPAFYRNIQISMHRLEAQIGHDNGKLGDLLGPGFKGFLGSYLGERIPSWIDGKHNDFTSRMTTEAGRRIASERIGRLTVVVKAASSELDSYEEEVRRGRLAVIRRFMTNRTDPSLTAEIDHLTSVWTGEANPGPGAAEMLDLFRTEMEGLG